MFASRTLSEHVARGTAAALAIAAAILVPAWMPSWTSTPAAILLGVCAIVLLRGCPMCWAIGVVGILRQRRPACTTCNSTQNRPDHACSGAQK